MPYKTEWVEPALFLEHNGVKVWHVYKDDDVEQGLRSFWFVSDPINGENDGSDWDVRDLAAWGDADGSGWPDDSVIRAAIIRAIESGELTQDGPCQKLSKEKSRLNTA